MRSRALLSRIKAMLSKDTVQPAVIAEPQKKADFGKVSMVEPESGNVVKVFESIESAIEDGFNLPNLVGAIKTGRKYKGHLWTSENELT